MFTCRKCGGQFPQLGKHSLMPCHELRDGILCSGSGMLPVETKAEAPVQRPALMSWDDWSAVLKMPEPELPPPPAELCKGGTEVVEGCVPCGNAVYKAITGYLPETFGGWRDAYQRTGLPWAKERMEELVTVDHASVLDEDWKPPLGPASEKVLPDGGGPVKLPPVVHPAAAAFFIVSIILTVIMLTAVKVGYGMIPVAVSYFISSIFVSVINHNNRVKAKRRNGRS
jgi:hypothetical protein